jgi:cation diffusion facilitator CzcD-associated flavoprotein CzcO
MYDVIYSFSGLCAAIRLKMDPIIGRHSGGFVIFDENEDVGGTWLVNSYPGCACDIPSHLYSFSFDLNAGISALRG